MNDVLLVVLFIVLIALGLGIAYVLARKGTIEDIHDYPFRFDNGSEYRKKDNLEEPKDE